MTRRSAGFTLVEVMISLAILAGALVVLLRGAAVNLETTQRAQMLTAATELARSKMYDLEEQLLDEGFQELDQEVDGDFSEEGWPRITWEAQIVKIELPNLAAMQELGAEGGDEGGASESDEEAGGGVLGGIFGMAGGLGGADGGAGAGLIQAQFELFRNVLEQSIRKVTLTLSWQAGAHEEELVVDCYFTDPSAVNRVIPTVGGSSSPQVGGNGGAQGAEGGQGGSNGLRGRGGTVR